MELGPPVSKSRHSGGARGGSREDVLGRRAMPPRRGRRDGRARNPPAIAPRSLARGNVRRLRPVAVGLARVGEEGTFAIVRTPSRTPGEHGRDRTGDPRAPALPGRLPPSPARQRPQLLHRRARRPRQVDARRPPARDHRSNPSGRQEAVPRSAPGGARAGDHGQGAERLLAPRGRAHGGDVPAEPHRHPRARRLLVRGVPIAGGLPRSAAAGRRGAGHPGADDRDVLPGDGARPSDRAGGQQDRQRQRRRGGHGRTVGERLRHRRQGAGANFGQGWDKRGRGARCDNRQGPRARRRRVR